MAVVPAAWSAQPVVLYFNEDNERVAVALGKLRAAMAAQRAASVGPVRIDHVKVDYGDLASLRRSLREAQARRPAAIVASSALIAQIARNEGITVPLVFAAHQDPVRLGLVESLRRPGGTMTGILMYRSDEGKRLELLREVAPGARRIGVTIDTWWDRAPDDQSPSAAVLPGIARELGFELEYFRIDTMADLMDLPRVALAREMDAWYVPTTRVGFDQPEAFTRTLASLGKPAVYANALHARSGGLLSYQSQLEDPFATWAKMIALIVDGFPVGEIPVERPRAFELAVNAKAARELRVPLPKSILLRATHFY